MSIKTIKSHLRNNGDISMFYNGREDIKILKNTINMLIDKVDEIISVINEYDEEEAK